MSEEAEMPEGTEEAPKKRREKTVTMVVLRDFWQRGDGSEDDRVRAGTKMEVSVGAAMAGLEAGSMRRATDND